MAEQGVATAAWCVQTPWLLLTGSRSAVMDAQRRSIRAKDFKSRLASLPLAPPSGANT